MINTCPATFTKVNSYLCMTGWAVTKLPFDDAQLTCHTMGAHICKYPEIQMGWSSQPPILGWIGNRVGDDQALCINNNNNVDNPEGVCNKNSEQSYRCCISTTSVE